MNTVGWIKLHRSVGDHWIYGDDQKCHFGAWIDLLMRANYEDNKARIGNQLYLVERGQLLTSILKLSQRWKRGRKWIRSFLDLLEKDGMIHQKRDTKFTLLTICNYDRFQLENNGGGHLGEQRWDTKGTSEEHLREHNIRSKEVKKVRSKEINKETKDKNLRQVADATRQAEAVFNHWKLTWNSPRSIFDDKRKKIVKAALKAGHSIDDLKEAIEGMHNCPHNLGQNEQGVVYNRIGIVLKDADSIDRFRRMYETPPVPNTGGMTIDQSVADGMATAKRIMEHQKRMEEHEYMITDQNNNNKIGETYDNSEGGTE